MAGMTAHKHVDFSEEMLSQLKKEALRLGISTNELIRRKLEKPPVPEEIILLRQFKEVLKNGSKVRIK